jgi:hypothetical protein
MLSHTIETGPISSSTSDRGSNTISAYAYVQPIEPRFVTETPFNAAPTTVPLGESGGSEGLRVSEATPIVTIPSVQNEWTQSSQNRYLALVKAEAVGKLPPQERKELENLQVQRRRLHHPRSPEEIVWEYRQQSVTEKLIEALHEYVQFYKTKDKTGISS